MQDNDARYKITVYKNDESRSLLLIFGKCNAIKRSFNFSDNRLEVENTKKTIIRYTTI